MFPFNNMRSTQTYLIHLFQEVVGLGRTLGPTGEDHQVHVPGGPDRRKSVKRNVGWDVHTKLTHCTVQSGGTKAAPFAK